MYIKMSNLSNVRKILIILDKMGYNWINGESLLPWWDNVITDEDKLYNMSHYYLTTQTDRCVAFTDLFVVDNYEKDAEVMTDIEYIKSFCSKEKYFIVNKEVQNV